MPLMIRLRKQGRTNRQTFRLVVTDGRNPRDGKYLENLGWFLPREKENRLQVNEERIQYWLSQGAQMSENAESFIGKAAPSVIKAYHEKMHTRRQKEAAKKRALRQRHREKGAEVTSVASAESGKAPVKEASEKKPVKKAVKKSVKKAPAKGKKTEEQAGDA